MALNSLLIVMTVYDGHSEDDNILNQRVYNFLNPNHRAKIAKTAWWAMHNGHELVTRPVEKDEQVTVMGRDRGRENEQASKDGSGRS